MLANLFGSKKTGNKFTAKQKAELEVTMEDGSRTPFACRITEVAKKKIKLEILNPRRDVRPSPGQSGRLCCMNADQKTFFWGTCDVQTEDFSEVEVSLPATTDETTTPGKEDRLDCSLTVDYKAPKAPSAQKGEISAIEGERVFLVTNMKLPPKMEMGLEISLGHWGTKISASGMTVNSVALDGSRKHQTELEITRVDPDDLKQIWECCAYAFCRNKTS